MRTSQFGIVGLGVMGRNLALKEVVSPMLGAFLPLAVSALFALIPAGDDR